MAKLKKIAGSEDAKPKAKSTSSEVIVVTDKKIGSLISKAHALKSQESELRQQADSLKAEYTPMSDLIKVHGLGLMIQNQKFFNAKLKFNDDIVAVNVIDKCTQPKDKEAGEKLLEQVTAIVGEDKAGDFVDYQASINPLAIENEKLLKELETFSVAMAKKYNINIIENKLFIKPKIKDSILDLNDPAKERELLAVLNMQINFSLAEE